MKNIVNIRLKLPEDFSLELDEDRLLQKKSRMKTPCTKAELIIRYAQLGRKHLKGNEV